MEWTREGEIGLPRMSDGSDAVRALRPSVVEDADGTLRMWYAGSDGETSRILGAICRIDNDTWEPLGVAIDVGATGDSDSYAAESPCVVGTPGGYLMVYGGFDGEVERLHMATSDDGRRWEPQGTIMQRGDEDAGGANDPWLLMTGEHWWLFYTGISDPERSRTAILAAVSQSGSSWDRAGAVLEPEGDEVAVSHPCVIQIARTFYGFYGVASGGVFSIAMASSPDGVSWNRRGVVLEPTGAGPDGASVHMPCVVRRHDGSVMMWYAGLPVGDAELGYRICSASFPGPWAS